MNLPVHFEEPVRSRFSSYSEYALAVLGYAAVLQSRSGVGMCAVSCSTTLDGLSTGSVPVSGVPQFALGPGTSGTVEGCEGAAGVPFIGRSGADRDLADVGADASVLAETESSGRVSCRSDRRGNPLAAVSGDESISDGAAAGGVGHCSALGVSGDVPWGAAGVGRKRRRGVRAGRRVKARRACLAAELPVEDDSVVRMIGLAVVQADRGDFSSAEQTVAGLNVLAEELQRLPSEDAVVGLVNRMLAEGRVAPETVAAMFCGGAAPVLAAKASPEPEESSESEEEDGPFEGIRWSRGDRTWRCGACALGFERARDASRHVKLHYPGHTCECGAQFPERKDLVRHRTSHSPGQHVCPECRNVFKRKDGLVRHLRSQHGYSSEDI